MTAKRSNQMLWHCWTSGVVFALLAGCSAPQKMSEAQLDEMGVRVGANHWDATSRLVQKGYICSVSVAKREYFDCTKSTGFFPTCLLHVDFDVDDQNKIRSVRASEPACIGTP